MFLFEKLDNEEVLEAFTMARLIWLRRNDYVFSMGLIQPCQLLDAVKVSLDNFSQAHVSIGRSSSASTLTHHQWTKPPNGK
jgi:hypothetical protein